MSKQEKGWKGVALHVCTRDSRIQETKIKRSIVTDENRTAAGVSVDRVANLTEYPPERVFFRQRRAQRMEWIDTGNRQRRRIESRAFEWFDVKAVRCTAFQRAVRLHVDEYCCDFQQCVRG